MQTVICGCVCVSSGGFSAPACVVLLTVVIECVSKKLSCMSHFISVDVDLVK